ncbi:hypothetical protein MES5069_40070 [Mesorhizobium escarrei]|uniref:Uncharacterized protein n=1 Tax=Mesorhizobium escarrei TaxID=666018 RepID=A0ABN8K336_9HYPH|nr:hypothetical protein MES5069_40070 [Mesorhizobium escarrei]
MAVWAREWALVREWEEWPWCDFLPLALCLGGSPTSAGIFETTPFRSVFARADARRTTTHAYGSDASLR